MHNGLKRILADMAKELEGFVAAAVVVIEDGLPVAELSLRPEVESQAAAAYLASVVKSNRKAVKLLSGSPVTNDIIILNDEYSFIIRPLEHAPFFLFVMTLKGEWLGRTRLVMDKYQERMQRGSLAEASEMEP